MPIISGEPAHEIAATAAVARLTSGLDDLIREAVTDSEIERTTNQMRIPTAPLAEWAKTQIPSILAATAPELENVSQAVRATVVAGGTILQFSPPEVPKIRSLPLIYVGYLSGWLISAAAARLLVFLWSGQVLFGGSGPWWSILILLAPSILISEIVARIVEYGLGGRYLGAFERIMLGLQIVIIEAYGALSLLLWMPVASAIGLPGTVTAWIIASLLVIALLWFLGAISYFDAVPVQNERHLTLASVGSFLTLIAVWSCWQLTTSLIAQTIDTRQIVVNGAVLVAASGGMVKAIRSSWKNLQTTAPESERIASVQWSTQVTRPDSSNTGSSLRPYGERRQLSRDLFDSARTWRLAAVQRGIMPLLRNRINEIAKPGYSIELRVHDAPGLRQMHSADFIVHTRAFKEFRRNISAIRSGAVGLAGPRGSGKTTLLNAIASGELRGGRRPKIVIAEAVPVKYDARDFVLHLFGRACDAVILLTGSPIAMAPRAVRVPIRTWVRLLLFASGWVFVAFMGARVLQDDVSLEKQIAAVWWPFMIGVAILGLVLIVTDMFSRLMQSVRVDDRKPMNTIEDLRQAAEQRLTEVRFQQRYSTGWSGKISTPFGSEFSGTRTTELTEMVRSYPEIVHEFRSFLMGVLAVLGDDASGDPQLIIIIDELDKISTSAAAEQFINEIKSIFDLGHNASYLYMVSVSEEALASFEQEALTARDAFNSAFDEILRIDYLRLTDTYTLLQSRIIGMAEPFLCMCHCLSGGLPREVIRVARKVVDQAGDGVTTLGAVMSKLMIQDLRDRFHGLESAVDDIAEGEPYASDLLIAVGIAIAEPVEPALLLEAARMPTLSVAPASSDLASVALNDLFRVQFATLGYLYYAATMMEIFSDGMSEDQMRLGRDIEGDGSFDRLSSVRGQIARRPRQAWLTVTAFRRVWQLTTVEPPASP